MSERFDRETALWLRIITPERVRVQTIAHWVQVPTPRGLLGVWPLHAELITVVSPGEVEYESQDGVQREWVGGGLLHVIQGQVLILTESRERQQLPAGKGGTQTWEESVEEIEEVLGELAPGEREAESRA